MRRAAVVPFNPDTLAELLHLPDGTEIRGAEWSFVDNQLHIYVESPDLPEVLQGMRPRMRPPLITVDETGKIIKKEW